jgi:hypothetical protein
MGKMGQKEIIGEEDGKVNGLTKEEFMGRRLLASRRGRIGLTVLGLCLAMRCGERLSDQKVEEPAKKTTETTPEKPKNPALRFLGVWGPDFEGSTEESIIIQSWAPKEGAGPQKELAWRDGKKMALVMPVKFKMHTDIGFFTTNIKNAEFFGGLYKLPEGGYFVAPKNASDFSYQAKIEHGKLLLTLVFINKPLYSLEVWATYRRIR